MVTFTDTDPSEFERQRPRLFGLAYRLLGSAQEAEDVVQDAFIRWHGVDRDTIVVPSAWLAKVVTNLCLNRLTAARAQREHYVGPWLPEPVLTEDETVGPLATVEQRESVSLAMLVLLERLTPAERAVFVLREAFVYSHREIAEIMDLSEANCRQLHHRARRHVEAARSRFAPDPRQQRALVERFLAAVREGDNVPLVRQSGADAVITSSDAVGRLLGMSAVSPALGSVLDDLLTVGNGLEVAERELLVPEVGKQPQSLPDQVIAVVRDNTVHHYYEPVVTQLARGDKLVVVRPTDELPWAPRPGTHREDTADDE